MKHDMVNLKVIFTKNQEQAMKHLQFNSTPLPADSTAYYLFPKSGIKGFSHGHIWFFVHILWPSILEIWAAPHKEARLCRCFTKNPIFGALKMENQLFVQ